MSLPMPSSNVCGIARRQSWRRNVKGGAGDSGAPPNSILGPTPAVQRKTGRMSVGSQGELVEVLVRGDFERLLGTEESSWVEFKRDPYHLKTPRDCWELAKDVAAFANHQGGTIVIGVATERRTHEVSDSA